MGNADLVINEIATYFTLLCTIATCGFNKMTL